jgi:hypothetical protein
LCLKSPQLPKIARHVQSLKQQIRRQQGGRCVINIKNSIKDKIDLVIGFDI